MRLDVTVNQRPAGWRRHLEGWQAGVLAVLLGGGMLLLVMPRAAEPTEPPAPVLDEALLEATMRADEVAARGAVETELDVDVRALGRELRAYNEASLGDDEDAFARARERTSEAAHRAAPQSDGVRALRAYQMMRFLNELARWRETGVESGELRALGGDFIATVVRNRWCEGATRELFMGERELRVLFKKRWNAVSGLEGEAIALSVDEERLRLGFLLLHPFRNLNTPVSLDPALAERTVAAQRLRTIERLAELDPSYPAALARGIVFYKSGQHLSAADAFRQHLEARDDGPYTLRARNFLKAALDRTQEGP